MRKLKKFTGDEAPYTADESKKGRRKKKQQNTKLKYKVNRVCQKGN